MAKKSSNKESQPIERKGKIYNPIEITPKAQELFNQADIPPTEKGENILEFSKLRNKLKGVYQESFPEFAEIEKKAPSTFAEKGQYADTVALDEAYKHMYIPEAKMQEVLGEDYDRFKELQSEFPSYVGGDFDTEGTGSDSGAFGIRSALLNPSYEFQDIQEGKSITRYNYSVDEEGNIKRDLIDAYVDPTNTYLNKALQQDVKAPKLEQGSNSKNSALVEVEKDELVLQEDEDGAYILTYDFKQGDTHEEGGEPYVKQPKDIVFPSKLRTKVINAIRNEDWDEIDELREQLPKTLPEDKELEEGLDSLEDGRIKTMSPEEAKEKTTLRTDIPAAKDTTVQTSGADPLVGMRNFIKSDMERSGVEFTDDKFTKILDTYDNDYDKVIEAVAQRNKIKDPEAFRSQIYDHFQITPYAEEQQPIIDEEAESNYFKDIGQSLLKGATSVSQGIVRLPSTIYRIAALPQNILSNIPGLEGMEVSKTKNSDILNFLDENQITEYYDEAVERQSEKLKAYEQSATEQWKSGDKTGALKTIGVQAVESIPLTALLMVSGGAGAATEAGVGIGSYATGQKMHELDKRNPNMNEAIRVTNSILTGAAEAGSEAMSMGSIGIGKKLLQKEGADGLKRVMKTSFIETLSPKLGAMYNIASPMIGEGLTEAASQYSENYIDMISGVDPDVNLMDGVMDAFLVGTVAGGTMSAPISIHNEVVTKPIVRSRVKNNYKKATDNLNDIANSEYVEAMEFLVNNHKSTEETLNNLRDVNRHFADQVSLDNMVTGSEYISSSLNYYNTNNARKRAINKKIAQNIGSDGNVTLTYYKGQPYSVTNPQDLGPGNENKAIFLRTPDGQTKTVISSQIKQWEAKDPNQVSQEQLNQEDAVDDQLTQAQQVQEDAAQRGLIEGRTVNTPDGKRTLQSINPDNTATVVNNKGEESIVNTEEIEAYKTQEQKDAEKVSQEADLAVMEGIEQGAEVVADEPLYDGSDVRVIDFSNEQSKIITPEGEQVFDTREERDSAVSELAQGEMEAAQETIDDMPPEQAFSTMLKEDPDNPEIATEIFTDEINDIRSQAEESRKQAKEAKTRKEKQALLIQAKQLDAEAMRLDAILQDPSLMEQQVQEEVIEEQIPEQEEVIEPTLEETAAQLKSEYEQETDLTPYNQLLPWQQQLLGSRINPESFKRFADVKTIGKQIGKRWFGKESAQNIDQIAQELSELGIEVFPQDIVDFIMSNPNNSVRKTTDKMNQLANEYRELTGESIKKQTTTAPEVDPDVPFRTQGVNVSERAEQDIKTRKNALKELNKLQEQFGIPIEVINSEELSPEAKAKARLIGTPKAYYQNGKAYILSDQIDSVSDVKKSYLHESVLHAGLDFLFNAGPVKILGKTFETKNDLLDEVFNRLDDETIADRAKAYGIDLTELNDAQKREIAEEALATVSETESPRMQALLDKLYNYIKKLFGFTSKQFSKADLRNMLREHKDLIIKQKQDAESLRKDEGQVQEGRDVREESATKSSEDLQQQKEARTEASDTEQVKFKVDGKELTKDELIKSDAFKAWSNNAPYVPTENSKEADFKTGDPVVVDGYHGGFSEITTFDDAYAGDTTADNEHGAFYFSSSEDVAADYSKESMIRRFDGQEVEYIKDDFDLSDEDVNNIADEDGNVDFEKLTEWASDVDNQHVVEGFIKFDNPYVVDAEFQGLRDLEERFNIQEMLGYISEKGNVPDQLYDTAEYDQYDIDNYKEEINERTIENHDLESIDDAEDWMIDEATDEVLQEEGIGKEFPQYDGLIITNVIDDIGEGSQEYQNLYISTTPSNIKSHENSGAFSSSEDIRFRATPAGQTDSKEFKQWFGNSEVVDTDGSPLVVYHGTNADFTEFDPQKQTTTAHGYGFYFATDKTIAEGYERGDKGQLIEAFLSIQQPLNDDAPNFSIDEMEDVVSEILNLELEKYADEMESWRDSFLSNMVDTYSTSKEDAISEVANQIVEYNDTANDAIAELSNIVGDRQTTQQAVKNTLGYDGIFVKDFQETDGDVYIAWFPNQVKSATENSGEFSPSNDDIRFRILGQIGAERLDNAQEATIRLDNLDVAKQLEQGLEDDFKAASEAYKEMLALNEAEDFDTDREHLDDARSRLYKRLGYEDVYGGADRDTHRQIADALQNEDITKLPKSKGDLIVREATGWERGDDGMWRYEEGDAKIKDIDRIEEIRDNSLFAHTRVDQINYEVNDDGTYRVELRGKDADQVEGGFVNFKNLREDEVIPFLGKQIGGVILNKEGKLHSLNLDLDEGQHYRYKVPGNGFYMQTENAIPLTDMISDKSIFDSNPELKDITVYFDKKYGRGAALVQTPTGKDYIALGTKIPMSQIESILNHEIQHVIQYAEGFAPGGNTRMFEQSKRKTAKLFKDMDSLFDQLGYDEWLMNASDEELRGISASSGRNFEGMYQFAETQPESRKNKMIEKLDEANKIIKDNDAIFGKYKRYSDLSDHELYNRLAGEVEARNVQKRLKLSPEERRRTLLSETEDVSREDQIFLEKGMNKAYSESAQPKFRVAESPKELEDFVKDSKVKETVYHGTGTEFSEFDKSKAGTSIGYEGSDLGFFFTDNIEDAKTYANLTDSDQNIIMKNRVNLVNPKMANYGDLMNRDKIIEAIEKGHDGMIDEGTGHYMVFEPSQILIEPQEDVKFRIEEQREQVDTNPSEAQKESGNYKMGHIQFDGFDISIENPKGSIRSGQNAQGDKWSNIMPSDYGYFKRTESADGDHVDVFLGDNLNSDKVYVVDQVNEDGLFDEHKVMMGFDNISQARNAYNEAYDEGWQGLGAITRTSKDGLKEWFKGDTTKPFAQKDEIRLRVNEDPIAWVLEKSDKAEMFTGEESSKKLRNNIEKLTSNTGSVRYIKYDNDRNPVSGIQIVTMGDKALIANAYTDPKERRKGYAKEIALKAKKDYPTLQHSEFLEDDGRKFAESVKFRVQSENPEIQKMLDKLQEVQKMSRVVETVEDLEGKAKQSLPEAREEIRKQIESIKEGAKLGKKDTEELIKQVQKTISAYAKQNIPLTEAGARDIGSLITLVNESQTPESIEKAFDKIDELTGQNVDKIERKKNVAKVNRLLKWMTGFKKSGNRKVGKFNYEDTKAMQELKKVNDDVARLNKVSNSYKSSAEQKMQAETEMDEMWNNFNNKAYKSDLDNAMMKLIELRRLGSKASPKLAQMVSEELEAIYNKAKDAKTEADMNKALTRREDKDMIKSFLSSDSNVDELPWFKKAMKQINTKTADWMGNWETLLTMMGGAELRDKYSLLLHEADMATGKQESTNNILDEAKSIYDVDSRRKTLDKIHELSKEEYSLREPNVKGEAIGGTPMKLSKLHLMDIYNAIKNEDIAYDYYMSYGDITLNEDGSRNTEAQYTDGKERIDNLVNKLSAEDMQFADAMQKELDKYYDKLNEIHITLFNRDLPRVENYWPSTAKREVDIDIMEQAFIDSRHPSAASERNAHRTPEPRDAFNKFSKHVEEAEWYSNMALPINEINKAFSDLKVQKQIKDARGEKFNTQISDAIKNVGLVPPSKGVPKSELEKGFNALLGNWVTSKIGATPTVPIKQLLSSINYAENMPTGEWAKGFVKGLFNPKKTWQEMMEIPYLKARLGDGYSEAVQRALNGDESVHKSKVNNAHQAFKNLMTIGTRYGDITAVIFGGKPYLDYLIEKEGLSEKEAVDKFLQDTLRSQQSPFSSSLSKFQNSKNVFARSVFAFANTPSQYMRKLFEANQDLRVKRQQFNDGKISEAEFKKARKQARKAHEIYGIINSVVFTTVGAMMGGLMKGTDWDDELWKDILVQIEQSYIGGLPVFKDLIGGATKAALGMKVYDDSKPILEGLDQVATAGIKIMSGEAKNPEREYENVAQGFATTLGIPYYNMKKTINAFSSEYRQENKAKQSNDKLNEIKKGDDKRSAEAATDLKQTYSNAKSKATKIRKDGRNNEADRIERMIEQSKVRLHSTDYSAASIKREEDAINRRLDRIR